MPGLTSVRARLLQVELEVLDVREADLLQPAGAAAAVLEVHLLGPFGGDLPQLLLGGALFLGLEEAGVVAGRQGDGQVPEAVFVGGADRRGVADQGPGVDDDAAGRRRLLPGLGPDLRLSPLLHLALQAGGEVRARLLIWSFTYRSTVRWETWDTVAGPERPDARSKLKHAPAAASDGQAQEA